MTYFVSLTTWAGVNARILQRMREVISEDMPIQQVQVALFIAENPGIGSSELREQLKMTGGSLSRNIRMLSKWTDKKTGEDKGYDLIEPRIDPYERRARVYYLTPNGQQKIRTVYEYAKKLNESMKEGRHVAI